MARLGTGRVVHARVACLADFLAMGEPRGAIGAGAYRGGDVVSLVEGARIRRPPPRLRQRAGERPPRSALGSQFTMGECSVRRLELRG